MNNYTYPQQPQYVAQLNYRPNAWAAPTPQVRPVSSVEEVRAYPIDFDGSVFYFPDIANKKIYTKSVGMDGVVNINLYELKDIADQTVDSSMFITREEFEEAVTQLKLMYEELLRIKEQEMAQSAAQQPTFNF